jgi:hypothetical protein
MDSGSFSTAMITGPCTSMFNGGDAEAVFLIEDEVTLRESYGFKLRDLNRAQELAEQHQADMVQKWHEHLG